MYPEERGLDFDDTLDPETLADPEFEGLSAIERDRRLDEIDWENARLAEEWAFQNRGWFKDGAF